MEEGEGGGRHLRLGRGDRVQRRTQDAKETYKGFDAKEKKNMWAIYAQKKKKKFQFSFSTERRIRIPRLV